MRDADIATFEQAECRYLRKNRHHIIAIAARQAFWSAQRLAEHH